MANSVDPVETAHEAYKPQRQKHTFGHARHAKIQISMCIRAVGSESSLGAFRIPKDANFRHADNEDWLDCADAQADVCLRWVHKSEGPFSHVVAHMIPVNQL